MTKVSGAGVLTAGMGLTAVAVVVFMRLPVHGSFAADLLPGFVIVGAGLGLAFVGDLIAATVGVGPNHAGLASGLINTSQQTGGTLALAITSTTAVTRTAHLRPGRASAAVRTGRWKYSAAASTAGGRSATEQHRRGCDAHSSRA